VERLLAEELYEVSNTSKDMHERIRVLDPDLADARLVVFQLVNTDAGPRPPVAFFDDGVPLLSFDELDAMVRETYEIWAEVLKGREAESRRRGDGTRGPLGI
jgi:hypothetical protein